MVKRFTLKYYEDTYWAYDNGKSIYTKEMVELLNELSEENERLKKELDCFKPVLFNDRNGKTIILYEKGDMYEEV